MPHPQGRFGLGIVLAVLLFVARRLGLRWPGTARVPETAEAEAA